MSKNLNSFILPDNIIETMKQKLKKTEEIRREFGFNLCQIEGSNELRDDTHCIGSSCQIMLAKTCKIGKKVGLFHTHPGDGEGRSDPSLSDLENGYFYGMNCVGGIGDKKIKCYVRKDKEMNLREREIIRYNRERFASVERAHRITTKKGYEIVKSRYRDRDYVRDKLRDYYFNIIDIE